MKKILFSLIGLSLSLTSIASTTEAFITGLKKDLFFTKTKRAIELSHKINVSEFGPLGRILSPDAIATYNGNLNTISLAKENLEVFNGVLRIRDAQKLRKTNFSGTYLISTIFHEMGHAELDVFIENEAELDDLSLNYFYKKTLKTYYRKAFSGNPHTIFHEHFGYYRSELIDFLYSELDTVMLNNGYNKIKNSCFLTNALKNDLKNGVSLEEFTKFKVIDKSNTFYRLKVNPGFVYVRGKDLDLSKLDQKILNQTHTLFWGYHQNFYNFPINQKQLVERLNAGTEFQKGLAKCREKFWQENRR